MHKAATFSHVSPNVQAGTYVTRHSPSSLPLDFKIA
jgi:hypothetical protein